MGSALFHRDSVVSKMENHKMFCWHMCVLLIWIPDASTMRILLLTILGLDRFRRIKHFVFFSYVLIVVTPCCPTIAFYSNRYRHTLTEFELSSMHWLSTRGLNPSSHLSRTPCILHRRRSESVLIKSIRKPITRKCSFSIWNGVIIDNRNPARLLSLTSRRKETPVGFSSEPCEEL